MTPEQQSIIDNEHTDRGRVDVNIANLKDQQIKYYMAMYGYFVCGDISFEHAKKLGELCAVLNDEITYHENEFSRRQDMRKQQLLDSKTRTA